MMFHEYINTLYKFESKLLYYKYIFTKVNTFDALEIASYRVPY